MYPLCCSLQHYLLLFSCSVMSNSVIPWTEAHQVSLFFTISQCLLKLMSIDSMMPSSHLILCHPLLPLPSIPPSIRVFSNESTLQMRWPKYYAEYIMRNAGLDEAQAGMKIPGRNINNLGYADDTTLMGESEELKSLFMKVRVKKLA